MATYSIIQKSQLEGALRLDAEYYQPEYLEIAKKINSQSSITIKEIADKIFSGPFGSTLKSESYQKSGVPFIRIGDIVDVFISKENLVYLSEKEHKRIFATHLDAGDIVLSKIATIGRLSVITDELGQVNISENNIGMRLSKLGNAEKIFLLFFLLSKYGQAQILQKASGNIQLKLNVADIENIKVPIIGRVLEKDLCAIYNELIKSRKQSEFLYHQAENLLLEELGLKDFKAEEKLSCVINLSDAKSVNRFDAEYFSSKYKVLETKLKSEQTKNLIDIIENVEAKFDTLKDPDKEFRYVELANIDSSIGMIDGFDKVLGREAPSRAKRVLRAGDVLVSSIEGSLEKVAMAEKEQERYLASTGFFQLRSNVILPEVLLVLAKSIIFQWQLQQRTAGTILSAVPKDSLDNILVPILPKPIQKKIANLVRQSHAARQRAKQLLEEAKRKVEEMIEKK